MADFTTKDGKEITFDLYTFTNAEYMDIFGDDNDGKVEQLIAKATGLTVDEFNALPYPDNRKIFMLFFKKCRDVATDPNLASASS